MAKRKDGTTPKYSWQKDPFFVDIYDGDDILVKQTCYKR